MFERIVVGVSKVESAQKAARYGIDLATKLGAGRILGSVPNDIAHRTSCSVLIVNTV